MGKSIGYVGAVLGSIALLVGNAHAESPAFKTEILALPTPATVRDGAPNPGGDNEPLIAVPGRIFAASRDPLMTKEFVDQFSHAYKGKSKVVWIEGGAHNGRESKDRYRDEIIDWLKASQL